jgi:hypothetical protein
MTLRIFVTFAFIAATLLSAHPLLSPVGLAG